MKYHRTKLPSKSRATHTQNSDGSFWVFKPVSENASGPAIGTDEGFTLIIAATPQVSVPQRVERTAFRKALFEQFGITFAQVRDMIVAEFTNPAEQELALIDFEEAAFVLRSNPLVAKIAQLLAKTDEEVDAVFISAK